MLMQRCSSKGEPAEGLVSGRNGRTRKQYMMFLRRVSTLAWWQKGEKKEVSLAFNVDARPTNGCRGVEALNDL